MKCVIKKSILLTTIFFVSTLWADVDDAANQALDNLKGLWNGASGFVSGMGEAFGYVPENYRYSFRVWNDSPGIILVAKQEMTKVLGAGFQGDVKAFKYLAPYTNTEGEFNDLRLYFVIWLIYDPSNKKNYEQYKSLVEEYAKVGTAGTPLGSAIGALIGAAKTTAMLEDKSFYSKTISIPVDVKNVNYYRAYTYKGAIQGEYLGVKMTTNEFTGVFYNSSDSDVVLQFTKDSISYKATLEKGKTFSLLHSTTGKPGSIRPTQDTDVRAFNFLKDGRQMVAIPIKSEGICNVQMDPDTKKITAGSPMMYTFEVSNDKSGSIDVSMQGLAIGHYDQPIDPANPTKNAVRDINPMECHVWYQSAKDAQASASKDKNSDPMQIFSDDPNPVWLFYKSKDYTYQKKISPGKVVNFTLLRPQLSEKKLHFLVVRVQSNDDTKALQFLNRIADGAIGKDALKNVTPVITFDENTLLTTIQPNTRGLVDDTAVSGVKGYILLADSITPRGVGTGPFYYTLKPSIVFLSELVQLFSSYLDSTKYMQPTMQQELLSKIQQWIAAYPQNKTGVMNEVTQYLQQKGIDDIITDPTKPNRILNDTGKKGVTTLVEGPVSIAHYPSMQQSGSNQYVYYLGDKPDDWPSK